jgi:hypothetical protein
MLKDHGESNLVARPRGRLAWLDLDLDGRLSRLSKRSWSGDGHGDREQSRDQESWHELEEVGNVRHGFVNVRPR